METGLMAEVLKQFGFEEARKQQRLLLATDYVFTPRFPAAQPFKNVYERVFLEETPLAVVREIHLQHNEKPHTSAKVTLALCWNGFADAMALLQRFANSFQRAIPVEQILNTVPQNEIGDFGVAWAWEPGAGALDVIAFVRFNVLVAATGHDTEPGFLLALANQIDRELRTSATTEKYTDQTEGLFTRARSEAQGAPRTAAGGRLDLGEFAAEKEGVSLFFLASSGSVNRDPESPQKWYYRAGVERGQQEITLYRVGKGILPARERLRVEVS
jgi:hypothetical protein